MKLTVARGGREPKNKSCVGGLRTPNQTIARSNGWQRTRQRVMPFLENIIFGCEADEDLDKSVGNIGIADSQDIAQDLI